MTPTTNPRVRLIAPLRDFLRTEAAGGVVLAAAALVAMVWANSPWQDSYHDLFHTKISLQWGSHALSLSLQHWINDALMVGFFFVVGLEITRELTSGHLADRRAALVPAVAAVGGMVVPALLYLAIAGGTEPKGWAVPMATDIALALGIVALAGDRISASLRVFLLALAIVDDLGAILVIALVYTDDLQPAWLALAGLALAATVALRRLGVRPVPIYLALGVALWFGLHEAGVHATLAGVAMGLLTPTTPHRNPEFIDTEELANLSTTESAIETVTLARDSVSTLEWLEHVLHPWVSFGIVPLFALANAGITLTSDMVSDALTSAVAIGIVVGLVAGKPLGILGATRLMGHRASSLMGGTSSGARLSVATAAGIGFTVALFVAELAFDDPDVLAEAKLAILVASTIAALAATVAARGGRAIVET